MPIITILLVTIFFIGTALITYRFLNNGTFKSKEDQFVGMLKDIRNDIIAADNKVLSMELDKEYMKLSNQELIDMFTNLKIESENQSSLNDYSDEACLARDFLEAKIRLIKKELQKRGISNWIQDKI